MKKINKLCLITLILTFLIGFFAPIISNINIDVYASEYTANYYNLTDSQLESLTNRTSVSSESPQITVFTHGLGGEPSNWSNNIQSQGSGTFDYEQMSMIEQLRSSIENDQKTAVVYTVRTEVCTRTLSTITKEQAQSIKTVEDNSTNGVQALKGLYSMLGFSAVDRRLTMIEQQKNNYNSSSSQDSLSDSDIGKHIILIIEAHENFESNDFVYAQLEYILDCISYQYRQFAGVLPTYNLIGHSRGGITNMQYALAHPYNVASI